MLSIGTHQYGGRCTDLAEYRKFPGAGIRGIDELHSVGPRSDVEAAGVTEVDQHRLGLVQQREHSHGAIHSRQVQVGHAAPQQRMSLTEVIRDVEARDHGGDVLARLVHTQQLHHRVAQCNGPGVRCAERPLCHGVPQHPRGNRVALGLIRVEEAQR